MTSFSFLNSVNAALFLVWQEVLIFAPLVIIGLLVFVLGLVVAKGLGGLVEKLLMVVKLDSFLSKTGVRTYFDKAGVQLNSARFFGELVRWFIILAFLMATTDILRLDAVTQAIRDILAYFPNVVVATLVMVMTLVFANFLQRVVKGAVAGADIKGGSFVSTFVKWTVSIFGLLIALHQLEIAVDIINILFTGLVAMMAIAGGVSFGLGGKDFAHDLVEKLRKDVEER
ncbi:MAG: CmpX protein [Parcubacteria group bacterium GW2011_GWC1_45_9]|nr:MAG: Conserved cytoplasmic membrane protein, CmpX protein [Parcubacteria group bacterium GW2011_GWA1_Parcubacteria_45_10]KKT87820.1 MAG: Conserved cytoplasmic membrane protein, CmpX protein [Parcubacteria group bacterium GW2011_GWB1_45_10]KKU16362.1 MAG: CmpX protein [Parcubacteria group bacterium GW2011_GWC1_45_9]